MDKARDEARSRDEVSLPRSDDMDLFANAAVEKLNNLNFIEKREIVCSVIEKIVGTPDKLTVYGHIPVTRHVELCSDDRHSLNAGRHQALSIIPFEFLIPLPPPQKKRVIVARDRNGRIINSMIHH